jgi:hypothetical protein
MEGLPTPPWRDKVHPLTHAPEHPATLPLLALFPPQHAPRSGAPAKPKRPEPIDSRATQSMCVRHSRTNQRTNEEQRSLKMTAKQWAARAVMAAAMAAGLSACGGGGDSAAPTVAPAPEELTAGLTIKESTDTVFRPAAYPDMKVLNLGTKADTATEYVRYAERTATGGIGQIGLLVKFSKTTGQVSRVTLLNDQTPGNWHALGCGFDGFACDNSKITVDPATSVIRVTSMPLKTLTFSQSAPGDVIISDPDTHLAANPGTATISGIVTLK